jgi:L-2-hydroxyglutarate oxidase
MKSIQTDYLIVGGGVIGIATGIAILERQSNTKVLIIEKSEDLGAHASGRNSGVLHAGFYYSPDSLKAKFCRDGNVEMKKFCREKTIPVLNCGKVVVAKNDNEAQRLEGLLNRGLSNGVELELLPANKLESYEVTAKTTGQFIWSPATAVVDPKQVLSAMMETFTHMGGKFIFGTEVSFVETGNEIYVTSEDYAIDSKFVINAAGVQADKLANRVGVGENYMSMPFKGNYMKSSKPAKSKRLIYPVPPISNPFLGVHTTITHDGFLKIGPTALPALGRERYHNFSRVKPREFLELIQASFYMSKGNQSSLIEIAKKEASLLSTKKLIAEAGLISSEVREIKSWTKVQGGIRSQLIEKSTGNLVQDFIVEKKYNSLHFLNIVSPGWTSAIPFARHFVNQINF